MAETVTVNPRAPRKGAGRSCIRQAMAAVLCGVGFFLLLQLGLALVVGSGRAELCDPLYEFRLHHLRQQPGGEGALSRLVVMLGSSRTMMGLRGKEAGRQLSATLGRPAVVMNFGVSGGGPLTELVTWQRLRKDGVRPALTLIEVLPPLLSEPDFPEQVREAPLCPEHLRWQDLPLVEHYGSGAQTSLRAAWESGRLLPWHTHRIALLSRLAPALLPLAQRLTPWQNLDTSGSPRELEAAWPCKESRRALEQAKQDYAPALAHFCLGGRPCAALRRLLESCQREKAPALMVLMPEGPQFRSWYPAGVKKQIDNWLAAVSREYGVPLLDARGWLPEEDFWDSHHLRPAAAERFTERLNREVVLPRLAILK